MMVKKEKAARDDLDLGEPRWFIRALDRLLLLFMDFIDWVDARTRKAVSHGRASIA